MAQGEHPLTARLRRGPEWILVLVASLAGFSTYFSMYAFRKPFSAAEFAGEFPFFHTTIHLKTALVISQILGYALSKYLGIKVCSEARRSQRALTLIGLVLASEAALVLFGIVPTSWKVLAIFLNGMPLGMIWGLVVWYLEGRRTTEILLAALSCSQIVSSGVVKSAGLWLVRNCSVSEAWMPAVTGVCFLPLLLVSVWVLDGVPAADAADVAARAPRQTMDRRQRIDFVRRFFVVLMLLLTVFFFLTAYRDFRDNYEVDVLRLLGCDTPGLLSTIETGVGLGLLIVMGGLYLVRDNRRALLAAFVVMISGTALMGIGTALFDRQVISATPWMVLIGLGAYLAYVPFQTLLFERLMAASRYAGTAVFAVALADSVGYTGSVVVQLYREFAFASPNQLDFLRSYTYLVSVLGTACLAAACGYFFLRVPRVMDRGDAEDGRTVAPSAPCVSVASGSVSGGNPG